MMSNEKKAIWLDVDPGHDDTYAILLACHTELFTVLGISTIGGNQTVEKTTNNALRTLELIGKSNSGITVVKGVSQPLARPPMVCPEIHGDSGLDLRPGCTLKVPDATQLPVTDKPAIQCMWEAISKYYNENKEKVTIVATGPLTNVALLFLVYPQVKSMVDVSILGGSINFGNISPASEYNILVDPEACKNVFESGVKSITMVPLDVSHTALVDSHVIDRIRSIKNQNGSGCTQRASEFIDIAIELLLYFSDSYKKTFDFDHPPLHDPLAVAYLIDPTIFTSKLLRVDVETSSHLCLGRTVVDLFSFSKLEKNVNVCTSVKVDKFWDMLIHSIQNCYNSLNK